MIEMANLLDVSVSQLLGIEESIHSNGNLAEELAELNEQLARKKQKEKLLYQANQKRGLILFVTFLSMMITMSVKNEVVSILMAGICMLIAGIVLYRNLALFTSLTTDDLRLGIFRVTTLCNISILIIGIVNAQAIYSNTIGNEINPKILCAIFQVSSSRTVHGKRRPVCLLYGNFGDTIPIKTIMQDNNTIANSFSPFSEKVMTSTALRKAKTIPMIKMLILQSVVTRKIPSLKSSVVVSGKPEKRSDSVCYIFIYDDYNECEK